MIEIQLEDIAPNSKGAVRITTDVSAIRQGGLCTIEIVPDKMVGKSVSVAVDIWALMRQITHEMLYRLFEV